jgi:hypothetical protein
MLRSKKKQEKLFIASVMFVVQLSIELKILPTGGITFLWQSPTLGEWCESTHSP